MNILGFCTPYCALLWVLGLVLNANFTHAQGTVSGHISDNEGHSLPGVQVLLLPDNKGAITNEKGFYTLEIPHAGEYKLVFSFIGFAKLERDIKLVNSNLHIDIKLYPTDNQLSDVNIVAHVSDTRRKHASVDVAQLTGEDIRQNASNSLMQSLSNIAGVSSIDIGAGYSKPVIRGLSFNRVAVVENGIGQAGQEWGADHGLEIDAEHVERIELLKGPSSLRYGSDAIGGLVLIQPAAVPAEGTLKARLSTNFKSNNMSWGSAASVLGRRQHWYSKLDFSQRNYGDYSIPTQTIFYNKWRLPADNGQLKNTAGREWNAAALLGYTGNWGFSALAVSWVHQRMGFYPGAHGIPTVEAVADDGDSRNIDLPYQQVDHLKVLHNTRYTKGIHTLWLDLGFQRNLRSEYSWPHTHGYEDMPNTQLELQFDLATYSAQARHSIALAHTPLKIEYGLSAEWRRNTIDGYSFLIPEYDRWSLGGFVYLNYHLSHKLIVNGGVRYDKMGYRIASFTDVYIDRLFPTDTELQDKYRYRSVVSAPDFSASSFGLGLSWLPSDLLNVKLNLGKSFRVPNVNELSANGIHHGSFRFERGDINLSAEQAYQLDAVLSWGATQQRIKLSPFINYFTNYIYLQPTGEFADLPHAGQIYQFMQDPALRWGGELEFNTALGRFFEAKISGEYIYAFNLNTQYSLPLTPPARFMATLSHRWSRSKGVFRGIHSSLEATKTLAQHKVTVNELATPGYFLLNLHCSTQWQLGKQAIEFSMQIRNLLHAVYWNHLSYYRLIEVPEPGRNIQLRIDIPLGKS